MCEWLNGLPVALVSIGVNREGVCRLLSLPFLDEGVDCVGHLDMHFVVRKKLDAIGPKTTISELKPQVLTVSECLKEAGRAEILTGTWTWHVSALRKKQRNGTKNRMAHGVSFCGRKRPLQR